MQPAKLHFSPDEIDLLVNADWILTKNEILGKISSLLGQLHLQQKGLVSDSPLSLQPEIMATTPKISRGENYKGLPYLVLDYPRLFTRNNIFAIRSMFWWGKTLSTTLHLSGRWQELYKEKIVEKYDLLAKKRFLIAAGDEEWIHDVTGKDYVFVSEISKKEFEKWVFVKPFLKLALYTQVNEINNSQLVWIAQFKSILEVLGQVD